MKRTDVWEYHSRSFQLSSSLKIAEIIRIIFIQFYDCQHRVVSFRAECQWDSIEFYVGAVSLENGWNSSRVHKLMNLLWKINNIYCVFFRHSFPVFIRLNAEVVTIFFCSFHSPNIYANHHLFQFDCILPSYWNGCHIPGRQRLCVFVGSLKWANKNEWNTRNVLCAVIYFALISNGGKNNESAEHFDLPIVNTFDLIIFLLLLLKGKGKSTRPPQKHSNHILIKANRNYVTVIFAISLSISIMKSI